MVALTLEDCYQTATRTNKRMPTSLLIMSDNTVREAKNQYLLGYLNNLVAKYKMKMVGLLNLRKSHTHDRLDQCWGILARRVAASDRLLSAQSVIDILEEELARPGMRAFIGLETMVKISKLDAVRAWKDHFNPTQQVGLRGGLLEDSSANHCFISMLRKGKHGNNHSRNFCEQCMALAAGVKSIYSRDDTYSECIQYLTSLGNNQFYLNAQLPPLPWHSRVGDAPQDLIPGNLDLHPTVLEALAPSAALRAAFGGRRNM
eukprot:s1878_g1.t1